MKALFSGRISGAKAAGLLAALLLAWPAFLFLGRQSKDEESPPRPVVIAPPSKLNAVGLADNVDWEDMPGFFAVWADKLDWKNDKTYFAYWNPGSNSYSYFFEATRRNGIYTFLAVKRDGFAQPEDMIFYDEDQDEITEIPPIVSKHSPEHPFIFFSYFHAAPHQAHGMYAKPPLRHGVDPPTESDGKMKVDLGDPKKP